MADNQNPKPSIVARLVAPTPKFHKIKRNIALVIGAIAGVIATQSPDPMIQEIAKLIGSIAGGVALDSQTTVE